MKLPCYNGKHGEKEFRFAKNVEEFKEHCEKQLHIWFISNSGDARKAKVNGKVRTWKRDKNRIEVPLKYGMYEYATFTWNEDKERLLIPV